MSLMGGQRGAVKCRGQQFSLSTRRQVTFTPTPTLHKEGKSGQVGGSWTNRASRSPGGVKSAVGDHAQSFLAGSTGSPSAALDGECRAVAQSPQRAFDLDELPFIC